MTQTQTLRPCPVSPSEARARQPCFPLDVQGVRRVLNHGIVITFTLSNERYASRHSNHRHFQYPLPMLGQISVSRVQSLPVQMTGTRADHWQGCTPWTPTCTPVLSHQTAAVLSLYPLPSRANTSYSAVYSTSWAVVNCEYFQSPRSCH